MPQVSYTQQLSIPALRQLLASRNGPVAREILRRCLNVESAAKRNLAGVFGPKRIDTGRLRASGASAIVTRNNSIAGVVSFHTRYARWVHDGTGIYGPLHRPITPRRAKFLRFRPRGSYRFIYRRSVKGMPANPFLKNAMYAARM